MAVHTVATGQSLVCPYTSNITAARFSPSFNNPMVAVLNPAMIPYIKGFEAALLSEKKYMTDINLLLISAALSFDNSAVGILFQHYGTNEYSERIMGAVYGKQLGRIAIGIGVQHVGIDILAHGTAGYIQSTASTLININDNTTASIKILNPNSFISTKKDSLRTASGYSFGIGWQASPGVYAGIESLKMEGRPLDVIINIQYVFAPDLSAAITWSTGTNQPFLCFGWSVRNLKIEAGCSYHAALGPSPAIAMYYTKGGTKK